MRRTWAFFAATLYACTAQLQAPAGAHIACITAHDCPATMLCNTDVALCTVTTGTTTAPVLGSPLVSPTVVRAGQPVGVRFASSGAPLLASKVTIGGWAAHAQDDSGTSFTFTAPTDAADGVYPVSATLYDLAGHGATWPIGSLTLDLTPPALSGLTLQAPAGQAQTKPGDTLALQATTDLDAIIVSVRVVDVASAATITELTSLAQIDSNGSLSNRFVLPSTTAVSVAAEVVVADNVGNSRTLTSAPLIVLGTPSHAAFLSGPPALSTDTLPVFTFTGTRTDDHFLCAFDSGTETACSSPFVTATRLHPGAHVFSVRAVNAAGLGEDTPVTQGFAIERKTVAVAVSGWAMACALYSDTTLGCWGDNSFGGLGNGTSTDNFSPSLVPGSEWASVSASGATFIATGHVCATKTDHSLFCWGANEKGELGNGSSGGAAVPTLVPGAWSSVATGPGVTCAIATNGSLWCWGESSVFFPGAPSTHTLSPVRIGTGTDWTQISVSETHACGLRGTDAYCWGQEPTDAAPLVTTPTAIDAHHDWTRIAVGRYATCGIRNAGDLYCAGLNDSGRLLQPTSIDRVATFTLVAHGFSRVVLGPDAACGVQNAHGVCWGVGPQGQTGTGVTSGGIAPITPVAIATEVSDIRLGEQTACAVTADHALRCWGENIRGKLGQGTNGTRRDAPALIEGNTWTEVGAGSGYTCALSGPSSDLYCWGQVPGPGVLPSDPVYYATPTLVAAATHLTKLSAGARHACAIGQAPHGLFCWGDNQNQQLDVASGATRAPLAVGVSTDWIGISAGEIHTCGIRDDGGARNLYCFGDPSVSMGNSGDPDILPVLDKGLAQGGKPLGNWQTIDTNASLACGMRTTGALLRSTCFGTGVGVYPQGNPFFDGASVVEPSHLQTTTVITSGTLEAQGASGVAVLGYSSSFGASNGPQITTDTDWAGLSVGAAHACAFKNDGRLYCWGDNVDGELGTRSPFAAVQVPAEVLPSGSWIATSASKRSDSTTGHTCGLRQSAQGTQIWCWGSNDRGQLGNGEAFSATPLAVAPPEL